VGNSGKRDIALSERLLGRADGLLTDIIGVFAAIGFCVAARLILNMIAPGMVPFALTFPAVMVATLFAGARAGVTATVALQLLVWYFVLPPQGSFTVTPDQAIGLAITTLSLFLMVWVAASYRKAMLQLSRENEDHVELLAMALREVDHRTKNNFQIAAALLQTQANAQEDEVLGEELRRAASRLMSIAEVHASLALSSTDLSTVLLHDYLRDLCDRVRDAMLPVTVELKFTAAHIELPARVAVNVGLIVNECLTNAAKHAFPNHSGELKVDAAIDNRDVVITIEDDGAGSASSAIGMGSRLITTLARPIGAEFTRHGEHGTNCVLRFPLEQRESKRTER
jgi:two-component sensor histidine kinase